MAKIEDNYYQHGSTSETGVNTPAHLINAYLSSKGINTQDAVAGFLGKYGVKSLSALNKNSQAFNKILSDLGKTSSALRASLEGKKTTPGSGVTAKMRANDPDAAEAQYARMGVSLNASSGGGESSSTTSGVDGGDAPDFAEVDAMIDGLDLAQDQKDILKLYAQANFTKNPELAQNIMAALQTSTKFATPQFKQQAQMLTDALALNFNSREGDLEFQKNQKEATLAKAEADYAAGAEFNTLEHNQQMQKYIEDLKNDTLALSDQMAASGFTNSSKRDRAQQILTDENAGLVESSTRKYEYQRAGNDRDLAFGRADTAAQIANLQRLAAEGKLSDLRMAESKLGSSALGKYGKMPQLVDGFNNLLGGQVGSENYDLTKAITSQASNFVY